MKMFCLIIALLGTAVLPDVVKGVGFQLMLKATSSGVQLLALDGSVIDTVNGDSILLH